MSLSVNGYGQQALLYQLMRRNGGSNAAPAEEAAPAPAPAPRAAAATGDSVSISSALADFLSLLGGSLTAIAQGPAEASTTAAPSDFEATLAGVAAEPSPGSAPGVSGVAPNGAADLASVLDAYAAIAKG